MSEWERINGIENVISKHNVKLAVHDAYFRLLGVGIGVTISLLIAILSVILKR